MKNDYLSQELFRRKSGKTRLVGPIKLTQHVAHIVWIDLAIKNAYILKFKVTRPFSKPNDIRVFETEFFILCRDNFSMYQHFLKLQQTIFNKILLLNYLSFKNETNKVIQ